MEQTEPVILLTREGCHLCEHVENMLNQNAVNWRSVDIESDPDLESEYGIRIPVLRLPSSGRELGFPFDDVKMMEFLKEQGG